MNSLVPDIYLPTWASAVFVLICGFLALAPRPAALVAMLLALAAWTRTLHIGPIAHTWVVFAAMYVALGLTLLRRPDTPILPRADRWIIPWMALWWCWTLFLLLLGQRADLIDNLRSLLVEVIAPTPLVMVFAHDRRQVREFAIVYTVITLIGGAVALAVLNVSVAELLQNPTLSERHISYLGLLNYHWFAYAFAISLLFLAAFFFETRSLLMRLALSLAALYCLYFLFMLGSRQSLGAVLITLSLFLIWMFRRHRRARMLTLSVIGVGVAVLVAVYRLMPRLMVRVYEAGLAEAFDLVAKRGEFWQRGIDAFVGSPIWGGAYVEQNYAHNFFISVLADQGLIGAIFLAGFLVFLIRCSRGIWSGLYDNTSRGNLALWRMVMLGVALFVLIQAQASGDIISAWALYWSTIILWHLRSSVEFRELAPLPVRSAVAGGSAGQVSQL